MFKNQFIKHNLALICLSGFFVLMTNSCKGIKEDIPVMPQGSIGLNLKHTGSSSDRNIYQADVLGYFAKDETMHRYWIGTKNAPSHKMEVRLLSNSPDIMFKIILPRSGRKLYPEKMVSPDLTGYYLRINGLTDREVIIEVMRPSGEKRSSQDDFRLFAGISGKGRLDFVNNQQGNGTKK